MNTWRGRGRGWAGLGGCERWRAVCLGLVGLAAALMVCGRGWAQEKGEVPRPPVVVVSLAPLKGLAQPLVDALAAPGGERAKVEVLIPPGRSEHGYEIPPSKLARLEGADLVVLVGMGLEPQVERFLREHPARGNRTRREVVFAEVVGEKGDAGGHDHDHNDHGHAHGHDHDHEHGEECDHGAVDPHLWLDPVLVERLVGALTREVEGMAGDEAAKVRVREAGEQVRRRVLGVHEAYALRCGRLGQKTLVVGHDAWGRLAERYGLETVAIAGLMASEPTPAALEGARRTIKEKGLKVVFAEPQLSDRAARRIAQGTGAEVRRLDPLGDGDWFAMMESNLAEIERACGGAQAGGADGKK